jgi:hypothetical protein
MAYIAQSVLHWPWATIESILSRLSSWIVYTAAPFYLVASSSWGDDFYVPIIMKAVGCVAPFADAWNTEDGVPRSEAILIGFRSYTKCRLSNH